MQNPPYRKFLKHADAEAIRKTNKALGYSDDYFYLPVDEEVRRFASAPKEEIERRLPAIGTHPDEVVPVLALRLLPRAHEQLGAIALARALREAEEDGYVWTPLLDALAANHAWPSFVHDTELPGGLMLDKFPITASAQLAKLEDWIRDQKDPSVFDDLLQFQAYQVEVVLAQHATCLSEAQVIRILFNPDAAKFLASNADVAAAHADFMLRAIVTRAEDKRITWEAARDLIGQLSLVATFSSESYALLLDIVKRKGVDPEARYLLLDFLIKNPTSPEDVLREVWEQLPYSYMAPQRIHILKHPNASIEFWNWASSNNPSYFAFFSASALIKAGLREEQQLFLYDLIRANEPGRVVQAMIDTFLNHQDTGLEVLRRIARDYSRVSIRERLAKRSEARMDSEIADILASSTSSSVLRPLIESVDTDAQAFVKAYHKVAEQYPTIAHNALKQRILKDPCPVPREWLEPLLRDSDSEVRLAAIAALGIATTPRTRTPRSRKEGGLRPSS